MENYFRSNINSIGLLEFNRLSNKNILFTNLHNDNIIEIHKNMKYLNIKNIYYDTDIINSTYLKLDYVICEYNSTIIQKCIEKKIKYFILSKNKNLLTISNVIHSIIKNKSFHIIYNDHPICEKKNILICGLGLIADKLIHNFNYLNYYVYDNSIVTEYDLCNQDFYTKYDINIKKSSIYSRLNNIHLLDINNNDEFLKMDIVINCLEDNDKRIINDKCIDFNIICYDVGIEKSMGHIIPIIPFKSNKININEYYQKKEIPECKIENPENIEHCIEKIKQSNLDYNKSNLLLEINNLARKININVISEFELDNYLLDKIPKLNSISYFISGILINEYLSNDNLIFYDPINKLKSNNHNINTNLLFINLDFEFNIQFTNDNLIYTKSLDYSPIYMSKIIVKNNFNIWDFISYNQLHLNDLINKLENDYNGSVFTIHFNNKLLYIQNNNKNISIESLCSNKNIPIYHKNIIHTILSNSNYDTILIPKIYYM